MFGMYVYVEMWDRFCICQDQCLCMFGYGGGIGFYCCMYCNVMCCGGVLIDDVDIIVMFGDYLQVIGCGIYDVGVDFVVVYDDCYWFVLCVECDDVVFCGLFVGKYDFEIVQYF